MKPSAKKMDASLSAGFITNKNNTSLKLCETEVSEMRSVSNLTTCSSLIHSNHNNNSGFISSLFCCVVSFFNHSYIDFCVGRSGKFEGFSIAVVLYKLWRGIIHLYVTSFNL